MTITYDSAAGTLTMSKGGWINTYPISQLPGWLAFYRKQQEMFPRYAAFYEDTAVALETLTADLQSGTM